MVTIRIDASSSVPIFKQIVEGIRGGVAAGVYKPGELIPSVRQLSVQILVNPNTVARAYEELERQGIIQSRKGIGMEVATDSQRIAQTGASETLLNSLKNAIEQARDAKMSRTEIDVLYSRAWQGISRKRKEGGKNE